MQSLNVYIRKATPNDVERIVRLANEGGPLGKPRRELPARLPDSYSQAFQTIDSDPNQHLMVAEYQGEVVGTFHLTFITYLAGEGHPDAQIEAIHVAADKRRKGVGASMLQWAINEAKKRQCRRVQLTTDKRRVEAHRFYQKLGFRFSHEGAKLEL